MTRWIKRGHLVRKDRYQDVRYLNLGKAQAEGKYREAERERGRATETKNEADMTRQTENNSIDILQWNCQGVRSKKDEILEMIEHYKYGIIALQETKL